MGGTYLQLISIAMTNGESDIDDGGSYASHLVDAYQAGLLNLTTVRRALYNTFQIRFRLGLFEPVKEQRWLDLNPASDVDTEEARQLNLEVSSHHAAPSYAWYNNRQ